MLLFYLKIRGYVTKNTESSSVLEQIRSEVESLIVEINMITDRNVSLLEDRVKKLNSLMEKADKRITLLKGAAENNTREIPSYNGLKKAGLKEIEHVRTEQKSSKKEQVLELYRNGFSSGIIASKTGISIGEVELIVSLASGKEEG